jgi:hypothetical protein
MSCSPLPLGRESSLHELESRLRESFLYSLEGAALGRSRSIRILITLTKYLFAAGRQLMRKKVKRVNLELRVLIIGSHARPIEQ